MSFLKPQFSNLAQGRLTSSVVAKVPSHSQAPMLAHWFYEIWRFHQNSRVFYLWIGGESKTDRLLLKSHIALSRRIALWITHQASLVEKTTKRLEILQIHMHARLCEWANLLLWNYKQRKTWCNSDEEIPWSKGGIALGKKIVPRDWRCHEIALTWN